jgi:pimeloyl-ACP methyl ester carboxylesterase
VLFIQGAFGTLDYWKRTGYLEAFHGARRVISLDLRGHGKSDKPHEASLYGFDRNASDVLAVLDAVDAGDVDVFGQSMGGQVVIAMLNADTSRIRSFATNGSAPLAEPLGRPLGMLLKRAQRLREGGMQTAIDDAMTRRLPGDGLSADAYIAYEKMMLESDVDAYIAEAEGQSLMQDQCLPPQGPPTLFIAGEHDALGVTCRDLPTRYPYVQYKELAGEGHFVNAKVDLFLGILRDWWASV